MTDIFKLTDSEKPARKQNALNLNITRTNQVRYGERSLRDLGPEIWNNLPAHIKSAPNLLSFKHLFKSRDGTSCKCNLCRKLQNSMNILVNTLGYREVQKQPPRGVLSKRCYENIQQIYRRHPCHSAISIKLQCNFIEITLQHGHSPVNLLHIFITSFTNNTFWWLLLEVFHSTWSSVWDWAFSENSEYLFLNALL